MEFTDRLHDMDEGTTSYALIGREDGILFQAYTDKTMWKNEANDHMNSHLRGYFLRKGFVDAISAADESILEPQYINQAGKPSFPESKEEAIRKIYSGMLSISGFKYKEGATAEQKDKAFDRIASHFVSASRNPDFNFESSPLHEFCIIKTGQPTRTIYNNKNPKNMISVLDVMKKIKRFPQSVNLSKVSKGREEY